MPKEIIMPHGEWGNDPADWQGDPEVWAEMFAACESGQNEGMASAFPDEGADHYMDDELCITEAPADDDLAVQFVGANSDIRYVAAWGKWLEWDGSVWTEDRTMGVFTRVRSMLRRIAPPPGPKSFRKSLLAAKTVSAIECLARSDRRAAATTDQWDMSLTTLNTPTGLVDLETGKVRPHDPTAYATKITSAAMHGDCLRWMQFLNEAMAGDEELIRFLQRMAGYAATGLTREHALFFCYGTGGNGKGIFLDTLKEILAEYAQTAGMETFTESRNERHPTDIAMLRGKRLVVAQETEEGAAWAEAKLKALTGGGKVAARFMRGDFFEFEPQFTLIIAGNHKPKFRNVDQAIRRRLHVIPFTVTVPEQGRDVNLMDKLRSEHGGILRWIVDGAVEYFRIGLSPPESVKAATETYLQDQDVFSQWLADNCETGPAYWETIQRLFTNWKGFAEGGNARAGTRNEFNDKMKSAGFQQERDGTKGGRGRYWAGIKIAPSADHIPENPGDW